MDQSFQDLVKKERKEKTQVNPKWVVRDIAIDIGNIF